MDDALLNGFAKIFYKIDEDSHIRLAHTAIVEKSSKILDCLLRHGLDSGSEYRAEKLTETAIEHDNSEALNVLLRNGEDKNSLIENNSNSLLATAIKQDKQSCIEVLLEKKAEIITYYMDESFTYLEKLAELLGGSVETLLKASVINPCRAHKNGRSLMHFAIEKKDISWLKMLNENFDLDLNQKTEQDKVPLLMTEAQDKIEYLIANGANVSAKINDTPILGEIKSEFIPLMLKAGANPNVSRFRMPLLHRAVCDGEDYVELLIEKGADVNAKDDSGRTVVESQLKTPEKLEPYLLALINAGFDFSQEARPGLPLCHALCVLFSPEHILAASKEKTFDVNALDINGNNSLMQACFAGKMENVKTLLALGANVNCSSKLGLTALAFAIYQNNESLVKLLVENGADVLHKFASLNAERLATKLGRTQLVPLLKPQGLMRKFKEILNI